MTYTPPLSLSLSLSLLYHGEERRKREAANRWQKQG
jgi:hypothetical protein